MIELREIVRDWLKTHGCDGLYYEGECSCDIDDLMPCGQPCLDCVAAKMDLTPKRVWFVPADVSEKPLGKEEEVAGKSECLNCRFYSPANLACLHPQPVRIRQCAAFEQRKGG